jgi:hypothetical protein
LSLQKSVFLWRVMGLARRIAILVGITVRNSFVNKLAKTARSLACQRSNFGYTRYNAAP